jgi:hypothetical protein
MCINKNDMRDGNGIYKYSEGSKYVGKILLFLILFIILNLKD